LHFIFKLNSTIMKAFRLALLTILLFGFTTAIQSQEKSLFSVGNSTVSVGIGLPSTFTNILIPPITTSYEYCIIDFGRKIGSIGVGGLAGYAFHRYTYGDAIYTDHYILIGPKGTYHFNGIPNVPELEVYGSTVLGVLIDASRNKSKNVSGIVYKDNVVNFGYDVKLGAKYWFKPTMSAYAEFGYGLSFFEVGLSFLL
jgi:hypothetical protein